MCKRSSTFATAELLEAATYMQSYMVLIAWNGTFKKPHECAKKKRVFDTWEEFAYLPDIMLSAVHKRRKVGVCPVSPLGRDLWRSQTDEGKRFERRSYAAILPSEAFLSAVV